MFLSFSGSPLFLLTFHPSPGQPYETHFHHPSWRLLKQADTIQSFCPCTCCPHPVKVILTEPSTKHVPLEALQGILFVFLDFSRSNFITLRDQEVFPVIRVCYCPSLRETLSCPVLGLRGAAWELWVLGHGGHGSHPGALGGQASKQALTIRGVL